MRRWWERAACAGVASRDYDPFFPESKSSTPPTAMVVMCFDCPVRLECRVEGYGESNGHFGNTSGDYRTRTRWSIFKRLWPVETTALDDHRSLRSKLRKVVDLHDDVVVALYKAGFHRDEVSKLVSLSPLDKRAVAAIARQEKDRTTYSWREAHGTPVGAL